MGQSKQQPMVDLDTGVYFRTNEIRHFVPLSFLMQLFVRFPTSVLPSLRLNIPFPQGDRCWYGAAGQKVVSAGSHHSQSLLATVPGRPLAFIPVHLPDLQGLSPLEASFLPPGWSPPSLQALFFLGPLLFLGIPLSGTTFPSGTPGLWFSPSEFSKSLTGF